MRKTFIASILLFTVSLVSEARDMPEVFGLSCNYMEESVTTDDMQVQLGWRLGFSGSPGSQSAYRILAASSLELLDSDTPDLWDSGKVVSSNSANVSYGGKIPGPSSAVYWKVKVWDDKGRESKWSSSRKWTVGLREKSDWDALWIGTGEDPHPDSAAVSPAPYFRKEFHVSGGIRKATAYVCGLGFYEMYLNGARVGDQVLAPAVTNYDRRPLKRILYPYDDRSSCRVLYNVFDITSMLRQGDNAAGAVLGNGWYNQRDRTVEGNMWYDTPRMICRIEIEYTDGSTFTVKTDSTWKTSSGPILHDGIFTGEIYDARLELSGWDMPGYDDSSWTAASPVRAPEGSLCVQTGPFDRVAGIVEPDSCTQTDDSTYLVSFPEMLSGWIRISVKGEAGNRIVMRFIGEENEDFGQTDTYVLKGGDREEWEPRFTWHAFRQVEIISPDVKIGCSDIIAKKVYTDLRTAGSFTCSNELFNRINEAYLRTQRNNFHGSISSDCPHRERLAYTGDAQVSVWSAIYSFDMTCFYRKWFDDMADARNKESGYIPHTAPFGGGGGGPAWGSAYVIMPWAYYCHYGDRHVLAEHYEGMKHWVEYLGTRTDSRGIVVREEPGGWCLGDWCAPGMTEIPPELVNTAYYYHVSDIMSDVAEVLGKDDDRLYFESLCREIRENFNREFFNEKTGRYWEGRQGSDVFPLAFGMVPDGKEDDVLESLLERLRDTGCHFDTGILATPLMLDVLSSSGQADVAYRLMDQREGPGFGYLLDDSFSCLWETWEGDASMCHPMFGSVVAWFYRTLAGIRHDRGRPGMQSFIIGPCPAGDLTSCSASYETLYGKISSSWRIEGGKFFLEAEVPANSDALVILPDGSSRRAGPGVHEYEILL